MCHHLTWEEWKLLRDVERREDEEARLIEVVEPEPVEFEPEPERDPDRELVHA